MGVISTCYNDEPASLVDGTYNKKIIRLVMLDVQLRLITTHMGGGLQ